MMHTIDLKMSQSVSLVDLDSHVDINSWFLSGHGFMWMPSLLLELRDEYP